MWVSMQMSYRGARFALCTTEDPMRESSADHINRVEVEGDVARPRLPADLAPLEKSASSGRESCRG